MPLQEDPPLPPPEDPPPLPLEAPDPAAPELLLLPLPEEPPLPPVDPPLPVELVLSEPQATSAATTAITDQHGRPVQVNFDMVINYHTPPRSRPVPPRSCRQQNKRNKPFSANWARGSESLARPPTSRKRRLLTWPAWIGGAGNVSSGVLRTSPSEPSSGSRVPFEQASGRCLFLPRSQSYLPPRTFESREPARVFTEDDRASSSSAAG